MAGSGRRYAEPVEVRQRDDVPEQFLWGGRLHVVCAVLARWMESGGWWAGSSVLGMLAGESPAATLEVEGPEREIWRVEAGSAGGTGVYDLCRHVDTGGWALVRVAD